ncbi:hypothetical protein F5051DRAFT_449434 [Lentinula edodes]|nr:hypothetical protein F5051DRAFT_449434 [Lentinula edodes]
MRFGCLSAWITIDGVVIPEYNVGVELTTDVVSCFVPSQAGKASIQAWALWYYLLLSPAISSRWVFTGISTPHSDGRVLPAYDPSVPGSQYSATISHTAVLTSPTSSNSLVFASVHYTGMSKEVFVFLPPFEFSTTGDDIYLNDSKAKDIGTISLEIMSVETVGQCPTAGVDFRPVSKLHDRARDSKIAHQIKLGPRNVSMAVPPPSIVVDPRLHFVTFVFQYRSLDALHAVGIVPRMPMTEFEDSEEGTSNARIPNAGGVDSTYQNLPIGVRRELINEADITEWHTTSKKIRPLSLQKRR